MRATVNLFPTLVKALALVNMLLAIKLMLDSLWIFSPHLNNINLEQQVFSALSAIFGVSGFFVCWNLFFQPTKVAQFLLVPSLFYFARDLYWFIDIALYGLVALGFDNSPFEFIWIPMQAFALFLLNAVVFRSRAYASLTVRALIKSDSYDNGRA